MASSQVISSPVKEVRRVLVDKTTNASWTPAKDHVNVSKQPVERAVISLVESIPPKKPRSPSQTAGRKRTIDELEDRRVNAATTHIMQTWAGSSPRDRFRIFEDSASTFKQTDSIKPALPTEVGSSVLGEGQAQSQDSLEVRSAMISTNGNILRDTTSHNNIAKRSVPTDPEARRLFVQKKALLLRSRIQTAMRYVAENSLDRKLSEYEAQRASFSKHMSSTESSIRSSIYDTMERKLLPAVSFGSGPPSPQFQVDCEVVRLSSPPFSSENTSQDDNLSTPRQKDYRCDPQTPTQPVQLSSPPGT